MASALRRNEKGIGLAAGTSSFAGKHRRVAVVALVSVLLASCSSIVDPELQAGPPSFNAASPGVSESEDAAGSDLALADGKASDGEVLPSQTAYVPVIKPTPATVAAAGEETGSNAAPDLAAAAAPADASRVVEVPQAAAITVPVRDATFPAATNGAAAGQPVAKRKTFLSSFFGAPPAAAAPVPATESKPLVKLASLETAGTRSVRASVAAVEPSAKSAKRSSLALEGGDNALPGVRQSALFEIKRKSGLDDDSDVDVHEEDDFEIIQVASAGGLARLAPNGLLKQTESVDTACLKPSLVRALKSVEQHYGRKMMITSGYRSPEHNRRARGAKNSLHMYCAAVDVQIKGVSKWELARYVRSMPGRGGVGTYCHTESVHIDVGPERDWNWRCGRRR